MLRKDKKVTLIIRGTTREVMAKGNKKKERGQSENRPVKKHVSVKDNTSKRNLHLRQRLWESHQGVWTRFYKRSQKKLEGTFNIIKGGQTTSLLREKQKKGELNTVHSKNEETYNQRNLIKRE